MIESRTRNRDIIKKREQDSKLWSWNNLAKYYNLHRSTVQKIYKRYEKKEGKKHKKLSPGRVLRKM